MPTASHARCPECGQTRHINARFNLCGECWKRLKPHVRREWRRIKQRRRDKRELAEVKEMLQKLRQPEPMPNGQQPILETVAPADLAEAENFWTERPAEPPEAPEPAVRPLLPKPEKTGTPEWTAWVRQFIGHKRLSDQQELEILKLYEDPQIDLDEIIRAYSIGQGTLNRLVHKHGLKARRERPEFEAARHARGRAKRRANQVARAAAQESAVPMPEEVSMPIAEAPPVPETKSKRIGIGAKPIFDKPTEDEIVRLYTETGIQVIKILDAYQITNGHLFSILRRRAIKPRSERPKIDLWEGHFEPTQEGPRWVPTQQTPQEETDTSREAFRKAAAQYATRPAPATVAAPLAVTTAAPMPAPVAQITSSNGMVPLGELSQRGWAVSYVVTRTHLVNAPTLDEALRLARESVGQDADIVAIQRA